MRWKALLGAMLVTGLVVGALLVEDSRYDSSRPSLPPFGGPLAWAAEGGDCSLCHDVHGGGNLLKPHPYPKEHPLTCIQCHFARNPVYEYDPQECFNCHEAGGEHAGLLDLGCFDCHGPHDPQGAPDLSNESCFSCHEASPP